MTVTRTIKANCEKCGGLGLITEMRRHGSEMRATTMECICVDYVVQQRENRPQPVSDETKSG